MSKLLSANFIRLQKSKEFWICAVSTLLISVGMIYSGSGWAKEAASRGYIKPLDDYFFQMVPYIGAIIAIFISLFVGTEYSDGTIRNKLIVGHTRTDIYLANFWTCLISSVVFTILWFIGGLPGLYLIGSFSMGIAEVIAYLFVAIGIAAALSAIFVWISMVPRSKAHTVVFAIVLWVLMGLAGSGVNDRLHEQEFHGGMAMINGEFVMLEDTPNSLYLTGIARTVFECLHRIIPIGQAVAMLELEITTPVLNIAVSVIVTVVATVLGILMYRRKDLK